MLRLLPCKLRTNVGLIRLCILLCHATEPDENSLDEEMKVARCPMYAIQFTDQVTTDALVEDVDRQVYLWKCIDRRPSHYSFASYPNNITID